MVRARGLGRVAALALCCLLAADEDAVGAPRAQAEGEARACPGSVSEFPGKPNPPGPIRFPDTRFEPVAFERDRRLGRRRSRGGLRDVPGELPRRRRQREDLARHAAGLSGAGRDLPPGARRGAARRPSAARKFFEENFRAVRVAQDRGSERLPHRLLRADRRGLAHPDRRLQGAALRPAARSRAHGAQAQGRELSQHRPRGAAHRARQVRAVFRSRRDRGRRARDAQPGDLLSQGRERSAVHPDPGLGARAPRPTARCCASITTRTTASPTRRSAAS